MKVLSIVLIVVCSFLQALGNTYHYSFSMDDFQINMNKEGDISIDYLKGITIDNEAGMPDLPLISSDIIIPDKVKYITSSISKNIKLLKNNVTFALCDNEPLKTISSIDSNVCTWCNPEYLIVTNEELAPHFKKLAQWKISKGIPAHIVTMKEIENAFNDSTSQLKLKKYLYSVYKKGNLKYVLLGGDDTVVPVQYCYGIVHTSSSQFEESKNIPADIYYACFGNQFDWDKNKNGIYGEYDDSIDASPSIYVFRLPLSTVHDVNSYCPVLKNLDWDLYC